MAQPSKSLLTMRANVTDTCSISIAQIRPSEVGRSAHSGPTVSEWGCSSALLGHNTHRPVCEVPVSQNSGCQKCPNVQHNTTPLRCHLDPDCNPPQVNLQTNPTVMPADRHEEVPKSLCTVQSQNLTQQHGKRVGSHMTMCCRATFYI